jgi:hypothetical protein
MTKLKLDKVAISERALLKRINRVLALRSKKAQLFKTRTGGHRHTEREEALGRFYLVVDGVVIEKRVDIGKLARDYGLLAPHETIAKTTRAR